MLRPLRSTQFYGTNRGQPFHKEEWERLHLGPQQHRLQPKSRKDRSEESGEMVWRHGVISRTLKR